jgi:hypothetical protein
LTPGQHGTRTLVVVAVTAALIAFTAGAVANQPPASPPRPLSGPQSLRCVQTKASEREVALRAAANPDDDAGEMARAVAHGASVAACT